MQLMNIYGLLLKHFGRQNWWPTKYNFQPKEWEIIVGAVLTQNTNWKNVEKALAGLNKYGIISPEKTIETKTETLQNIIRPSGFYIQKAARMKNVAIFFKHKKEITRDELLKVKGIGYETADSILLYAFNKPYFVVDAYTKRIFSRLGILNGNETYEEVRKIFEDNLPKDVELFKQFHALIVELGKRHCKNKHCNGETCPLKVVCKYKKHSI